MNVQELETAKRLGLAFVNIIWTDSAYGVIEIHQRRKFDHLAGTKFTNPDWVALAESFGIAGMRWAPLRSSADAREGAVAGRALVVEVPIDYRENTKFSMNLADMARVQEVRTEMAMTETVRKLLVGGEWYETGETLDVTLALRRRVVGRVASAAPRTPAGRSTPRSRRGASPLPAHKRAEILDRAAELLAERREEFARTIAEEAAKPIKTARVEADRAVQTFTFAAARGPHARRRDGADRRAPRRRGQARLHPARADRRRRRDQPVQLPAQPRRHKLAPGDRRRLPVVLKPAGPTPLSALLLAQRSSRSAACRPGWLNVVTGGSATVGNAHRRPSRHRA